MALDDEAPEHFTGLRPDDRYERITPIVDAIRRGDTRAWNDLHRRIRPVIRRITDQQFRLPRPDADDVEQTVWLRTVRGLDRLDNVEALPGWVKTTTIRVCCDVYRSRRQSEPMRIDSLPDLCHGPEDVAIRADRADRLRRAVVELPAARRRLVETLLDPTEPSYATVADRICEPIGSIGPHRIDAIRRLRQNPILSSLAG